MDSRTIIEKPEEFRKARLLIANGAIAAKNAALQRVCNEIDSLLKEKSALEKEIYEVKEKRDKLIIQSWANGIIEWRYLLERPNRNSHILAQRGEEEIKKLGLFTAGFFEKNQQKAIGVPICGESTNEQLSQIALSLEVIFPHLYAVTDGERSVIVSHSDPESFDLQIRQVISSGLISVTIFVYGSKKSIYFESFFKAVTFIRNNMIGICFKYKTRDTFK